MKSKLTGEDGTKSHVHLLKEQCVNFLRVEYFIFKLMSVFSLAQHETFVPL